MLGGSPLSPQLLVNPLYPSLSPTVYTSHGVVLKQVAHFYNSIDEQIIDCHYLMLEQQAADLENIIKNPKKTGTASGNGRSILTWDNPVELEEYIAKLQRAAERLMIENRKLRKYHTVFAEKVAVLFGVDLLRQQSKYELPRMPFLPCISCFCALSLYLYVLPVARCLLARYRKYRKQVSRAFAVVV